MFHVKRFAACLAAVILLLNVSACAVSKNPVSGKKRAYGYTWQQEQQLGKESHPQIVAQFGLYDDPGLQQYVNRVGQDVLSKSHLRRADTDPEFRNTPFTFTVLDSPVVNAFALPGGYIYVTRGLLTHLDNEAQLAVVLGHEIGHVAARHSSKRAFEQQIGQIGILGGAILGQEVLGLPAGDLLNAGSTATQLLLLSYGRDDERESDALGVQYAAMSNYKASEGAALFTSLKRLAAGSEGGIPSFMSTHPDPGEREVRIPKIAAEYEGRYAMNEVRAREFLNEIEGVTLGENPRQGFVESGFFYHPDLRFRFPIPSGFQVINQPSQVAMVNQDQSAVLIFSISNAASPQAAAQAFAGQQGLQVEESGPVRSGRNGAYYVLASAQTQQGGAVRVLTYYQSYNNAVYAFTGYSAANTFAQHRDAFTRVMQNLEPINDSRILNIKPTVVNVVAAPRTAAFRTFLPSTLPPGMTAEELAILNQVSLNDPIERGTLLKLPTQR